MNRLVIQKIHFESFIESVSSFKSFTLPRKILHFFFLCLLLFWSVLKNQHFKDQLYVWLYFLKNILSYLVCITSKVRNIHQIANFLRSEIMFSIPLAILHFLIRGYKRSIQLQISNLSSVLSASLCQSDWIELRLIFMHILNIKHTMAKYFIMIISTFLKWYSILPQPIMFY